MSAFTKSAGDVNDEAINTAIFTICKGSSIGSVRRNFGEADRAKLWSELCNVTDGFTPEK